MISRKRRVWRAHEWRTLVKNTIVLEANRGVGIAFVYYY